MSSERRSLVEPGADDHRLECCLDDAADPEELTVFSPESPALTTEWITIEYEAAVPSTEWV